MKSLLPIFWMASIIALMLLSMSLEDESRNFFGIAENSEQTVVFNNSLEIVRIPFLQGQKVKSGEIILEARQYDLQAEIKIVDAKLQELRSRDNLNLVILNQLKEKHFLNKNNKIQDSRIAELIGRKAELKRQVDSLTVRAQFDGYIGSVSHHTGETVAPFQPILTVSRSKPEYIKGYIQESVISEISLNQHVWVRSVSRYDGVSEMKGTIESIGNKIVEYPLRLKRNPSISAWGHEVLIHLPAEHEFLFGEKVKVMLAAPQTLEKRLNVWFDILQTKFTTKSKEVSGDLHKMIYTPISHEILSDNKSINAKKIEASAVLWDMAQSDYILVSDESGDLSFTSMMADGKIDRELPLSECPDVDDLESISGDSNNIYALASLNLGHNNNLKQKRKWFLRLIRTEDGLKCTGHIDFYTALQKIASDTIDPQSEEFINYVLKSNDLDIEAHAIMNGDLIIGLKAPLDTKDNTVILKISNVESLFFDKATTQALVWKSFDLQGYNLSDMIVFDHYFLILAVYSSNNKLTSNLLSYNLHNDQIKLLHTFPNLRAEGISKTDNKNKFLVNYGIKR